MKRIKYYVFNFFHRRLKGEKNFTIKDVQETYFPVTSEAKDSSFPI